MTTHVDRSGRMAGTRPSFIRFTWVNKKQNNNKKTGSVFILCNFICDRRISFMRFNHPIIARQLSHYRYFPISQRQSTKKKNAIKRTRGRGFLVVVWFIFGMYIFIALGFFFFSSFSSSFLFRIKRRRTSKVLQAEREGVSTFPSVHFGIFFFPLQTKQTKEAKVARNSRPCLICITACRVWLSTFLVSSKPEKTKLKIKQIKKKLFDRILT